MRQVLDVVARMVARVITGRKRVGLHHIADFNTAD